MPLQIFLSSTLRRYIPGYNPVNGLKLDINRGITVADICRKISVPVDSLKIVIVNGKRQNLDYILEGNERIGLFPPVGGG
jgi:molybdopterin synthase sulfur carrier subunit